MGKAALCVFFLLVATGGGVCGEAEASDRPPAPAPRDGTRSPGRLEAPETRRPAPTPAGPPAPAASPAPFAPVPAPAAKSGKEGNVVLYGCILIICLILVGLYGCKDEIWSFMRAHRGPPRLPTNGTVGVPSVSADNDFTGLPPLTREEMEALEDTLCIPDLQRPEGPVVTFRRAKPGKPNDDVVSPPPADVPDLLL